MENNQSIVQLKQHLDNQRPIDQFIVQNIIARTMEEYDDSAEHLLHDYVAGYTTRNKYMNLFMQLVESMIDDPEFISLDDYVDFITNNLLEEYRGMGYNYLLVYPENNDPDNNERLVEYASQVYDEQCEELEQLNESAQPEITYSELDLSMYFKRGIERCIICEQFKFGITSKCYICGYNTDMNYMAPFYEWRKRCSLKKIDTESYISLNIRMYDKKKINKLSIINYIDDETLRLQWASDYIAQKQSRWNKKIIRTLIDKYRKPKNKNKYDFLAYVYFVDRVSLSMNGNRLKIKLDHLEESIFLDLEQIESGTLGSIDESVIVGEHIN